MTRPPALVVFAKVPRAGRVKTRLVPPLGEAEAAQLYDAFLRDALGRYVAWGEDEGVAVRLYLDDPDAAPPGLVPEGVSVHAQAEGALGPRMLRAVVETLAAGHSAAVLIGTDHPTLPMAIVGEAVRQLATPLALVLGPASDGGYYLLGTGEVTPALFAMEFSHSRVFADTLARGADAGLAPVVLPEHDDVDDAGALLRLAADWRAGADVGENTHRALERLEAAGRLGGGGRPDGRRADGSFSRPLPLSTPFMPATALATPPPAAPAGDGGAFRTLEQFIIERQEESPGSKGQFSRLLRDIVVAAKIVDRDVRKAGLVDDFFGDTGDVNVQGEVQKKLDVIAHEEFVRALRRGGEVCLIGSEEHAEAIPLLFQDCQGKYVVLFDPLDGSSNVDVNVSIGTIFSIYKISDDHIGHVTVEHALQSGREQVAAGYIIYGSSTMLVYTTGNGVNGFTLDPSIGEFLLSHPNIRTPERGSMYSINEGNYNSWARGLREYIKWMQREAPRDVPPRPYTTRYIGSFVADFHRNLIKGGVYIYPENHRNPSGKLRLMYEANPLAMIVEQAGGMASTGTGPVLDVRPTALHQRTPLYIGSRRMVEDAEAFLRGDLPLDME